jgi:hypothetical protein
MTYNIEDIKRDIRIALDQNMVSTQLLATSDIDTLSLNDIIESKIAEAARVVMRDAPSYLLDGGVAFGESISWFSREGIGGGSILLPQDFLRLVSFQMSDWSRAVTSAILEDDPFYELQSSRYPGVRGNPQKPVVALSQQPIGLVLEFYSCTAGEGVRVKRATYLPIPTISDGHIIFCEKLRPAVVYYAAYLTALSINQPDVATAMLNNSKELMK